MRSAGGNRDAHFADLQRSGAVLYRYFPDAEPVAGFGRDLPQRFIGHRIVRFVVQPEN
jgi:hypothetical protein